ELVVADDMLVHDEALLAVLAGDDAGRPVAEPGVDVFVPEIERLEDVTVGVDDVIGAAHQRSSGAGFRSCGILAQRPLWRKLNVVQNPERVLIAPLPHRGRGRGPIAQRWEGE